MGPWEIAAHLLGGLAMVYVAICGMLIATRLLPPPDPPSAPRDPEHPLDALDEWLSGADRLRKARDQ